MVVRLREFPAGFDAISSEKPGWGDSENSAIDTVDAILQDAVRLGASDVHFEPYEAEFRIRFRLDGLLQTKTKPPRSACNAIVSRLKILSNLDIGERRLPQEGRVKIITSESTGERQVDLRVSSIPTLSGEKVAVRILDRTRLPSSLGDLGLEAGALSKLASAASRSYGMVLATGPTGSGKTSTLYTCLGLLDHDRLNIMTAEDPVEFSLPGINQVQVNERIGRDFTSILRAFLRHDPDIIMVGEIRELETAEIAVKAAMTGHLVFSTLHTNDAPSTISRLVHMGLEPYLVANSVHLICAQRLVRRICPFCQRNSLPSREKLAALRLLPTETLAQSKGAGCCECSGTGYKGRTGLFEIMELTPSLQDLIVSGAGVSEIRALAKREGMRTLREAGVAKIKEGVTTVEEVLRETV